MKKIMKSIFKSVIILLAYTFSAEASLSVHPGGIIDTISAGSSYSTILHITNAGPTPVLDYELSADVSWINFNSVSGSINKGDTVSIIIAYETPMLQGGINNANIYVGDPHHGPIIIPVIVYFQSVTDVQDNLFISPLLFSLEQNYPNPFNPKTIITYSIPETQKVSIKIYNILGNELFTVVDQEKNAGKYSVNVDMSRFTSGIYFYKLKAGKNIQTKKMILNK